MKSAFAKATNFFACSRRTFSAYGRPTSCPYLTQKLILSACLVIGAAGFTFKNSRQIRSMETTCCDSSGYTESEPAKDKFEGTAFYPPIEPFFKGLLPVSTKHTISYSLYGNPNGKPVLFVHGGPGGGTDKAMARYFDPAVYKVILVDQRGCGKYITNRRGNLPTPSYN